MSQVMKGEDVVKVISMMKSRIQALENKVHFLAMRQAGTSTSPQGAGGGLINLDLPIFCMQSPTGVTGELIVGVLDCVAFSPTDLRPNGGVGPTGAQIGFWPRRASGL